MYNTPGLNGNHVSNGRFVQLGKTFPVQQYVCRLKIKIWV